MDIDEPLKILIADDSNSDRLLLKAIVQNQGHEVVVAADGIEALDVFTREKPDIILLDALMPKMDGFEAAEKIKAMSGDDFVPIIFLTSLKEADSLARCLEAGGDDFLTKPYNAVILKAKINAFRRMLTMHVTVQQQRDQIASNNEHLIQEQEIAKRVFDKVAHAGALHVHNINYTLSPLAVFNGDVLLAAVRPSGNMSVLLGDFTGHGLAAAVGAMPLAQTFYSMNAKGFGMRDILQEINLKLKDILPVSVFCCVGMIDMDMRDKTIEVWNGGLPECYLFRSQERRFDKIASTHLPLGVLSPRDFSSETQMLGMEDGDRFFMWSDGILEATDAEGEMFGEQRLNEIFYRNENANLLFTEINRHVNTFIGDSERADDLSVVEITMVDKEDFDVVNVTPAHKGYQGPMDWGLRYDVRPDTLREFSPLPQLLQVLMDIPGLRPHSGEIYTVMTELYSNALEHGVLGLDSKLKNSTHGFAEYYHLRTQRLAELSNGHVSIELDYRGDESEGLLKIRMTDSGPGFEYQKFMDCEVDASVEGYSGRGIPLLRTLCRDVVIFGCGNEIEVSFFWSYESNRNVA